MTTTTSPPAADQDAVTLVITACNRPGLLVHTLQGFVKWNTYPIKEAIIVEDSGRQGINDFAPFLCPFPVRLVYNEQNIGQTRSIDRAYSMVRTPYIYHCEEDWLHTRPGFIEQSLEVLKKDPKVFMVWLRRDSPHPVEMVNRGGYYYMSNNFSYPCHKRQKTIRWYGIAWNPGLRRTADCMLFHPYAEKVKPIEIPERDITEYDVNVAYGEAGFRGATLLDPLAFVHHIGWGHHVPRVTD